ncbi:MAG: hypothetical protein ACLF0G_16050 [Candidatus Brocadiia bacterium]
MMEITVGQREGDVVGDDGRALQEAVDRAAAAGGGTVRVGPGVYPMADSLHLRSRVHVEGSGPETVLRKEPEVRCALAADLGYGHYDVSLAEPERFHTGMGVLVGDDRAGGFTLTVGTLTWREAERFGISRMLHHDYARSANGFVASSFPLISGEGIEDASVARLAVDGNRAQNPTFLNGCRGGGVFLIRTRDVALRDLHVAHLNADGISFQQTVGTRIEECVCEDNANHGLHPGSGSVGAVLRRCTCRRNGADGIYYCLRVSFSLCEECVIEANGRDGISIGGRDTDHLVRRNAVRGNARCGVFFRPHDRAMAGNRNRLEENRVAGNCRARGEGEVHIAAPLADVHLLRNRIRSLAPNVPGVRVAEGTEGVVVHDNTIEADQPLVVEGEPEAVHRGPPPRALEVGPEAAPPGAARHLALGPAEGRAAGAGP